eukprot:gene5425-8890_t
MSEYVAYYNASAFSNNVVFRAILLEQVQRDVKGFQIVVISVAMAKGSEKSSASAVIGNLWASYLRSTPKTLKIIDSYLLYILLTGTFPFNSFLSGFISSVGCFVLGGSSALLD